MANEGVKSNVSFKRISNLFFISAFYVTRELRLYALLIYALTDIKDGELTLLRNTSIQPRTRPASIPQAGAVSPMGKADKNLAPICSCSGEMESTAVIPPHLPGAFVFHWKVIRRMKIGDISLSLRSFSTSQISNQPAIFFIMTAVMILIPTLHLRIKRSKILSSRLREV